MQFIPLAAATFKTSSGSAPWCHRIVVGVALTCIARYAVVVVIAEGSSVFDLCLGHSVSVFWVRGELQGGFSGLKLGTAREAGYGVFDRHPSKARCFFGSGSSWLV